MYVFVYLCVCQRGGEGGQAAIALQDFCLSVISIVSVVAVTYS